VIAHRAAARGYRSVAGPKRSGTTSEENGVPDILVIRKDEAMARPTLVYDGDCGICTKAIGPQITA
jgi:hypothetical protein